MSHITADEARRRVFDETSLHSDIIKTWGEHGAHNDVFMAMRHQAHSLAAEVERLSADNERLQRVADWVRQYQQEWNTPDGAELRASIRQAMFDAASLADEGGAHD